MPVHVATHPLIAHKLTHLRDRRTTPDDFRKLLREISFYLGYEATRSLNSMPQVVTTPMNAVFEGVKIADKVTIVPILRAGLGMSDGLLDLMPRAAVHHIELRNHFYRLNTTIVYQGNEVCDVAFICDPCIATSNTISAVCSIVKKWGAKRVIVIATVGAKVGVDKLMQLHPDVELFIGAIDDILSDNAMIIPGIGDAGDRQFGTPSAETLPSTSQSSNSEETIENGKRLRVDP